MIPNLTESSGTVCLSLHEAQQSTRKQQFLHRWHRLTVSHFAVRKGILKCSDRACEQIGHALAFRHRQSLIRQLPGVGIERFAHQRHPDERCGQLGRSTHGNLNFNERIPNGGVIIALAKFS
jgi:hypothetical protein